MPLLVTLPVMLPEPVRVAPLATVTVLVTEPLTARVPPLMAVAPV